VYNYFFNTAGTIDYIYEWWSSECNVFIIILEYLTGIIYSYIATYNAAFPLNIN